MVQKSDPNCICILWKGLGKTKFCLDLLIDNLTNKIFVYQWNKQICFDAFYMDKSHSLSTPMIMRSLDINDDSVWSQKKDEKLLGDETPYLGAIRTLVHLTNNITRYLFCSKFTDKVQFLPDKTTLKWCWAHD